MNYYTFYKAAVPKYGLPPQLLRVMRITAILLLVCLIQVSAASKAQKLTFSKQNASLEQVFQEITRQTGYEVFYGDQKFDDSKRISVNFNNASLDEVLTTCLLNQRAAYVIEEKSIIIKAKAPSLLDRALLVIQSIVKDLIVKGKVTDQEGKPLPNASIRVKGKSAVTNTNQNGEFEIKGVDEDAVLLVSYVGYKTLEIGLKDAVMPLEIKLNVATGELEEVKVVYNTGYQELNKERATGSFVQIDNELLNRTASTNVLDRITSITNSLRFDPNQVGSPNNSNITIRGISTIFANRKPLIVVDGFPYEEDNNSARVILNNLNPNDVESITILRDAAAASIWGARAGNGVIVINTKKGNFNENTKIQFNSNLNITGRPDLNKVETMSSSEVIDFEKARFKTGVYNTYDDLYPSSGNFPYLTPAIEILLANRRKEISDQETEVRLTNLSKNDVRNDISKYLLRKSVNQQHSLSLSGGSAKFNYYGSMGYDKNILQSVGNDYSRYTLRINNTYRPINNLKLSTYIVFTQSNSNNNGINHNNYLPISGSSIAAPYIMLADKDGNPLHAPLSNTGYRQTYVDNPPFEDLLDWHFRPLEEIKLADNKISQFNTRLGGEVSYSIIPELSVNIKGQYEKGIGEAYDFFGVNTYTARNLINRFMYKDATGKMLYPVPYGGILDFDVTKKNSWNLRGQLNYGKKVGLHDIQGIAGVETSETIASLNRGRKYGYDSETLTSTRVNNDLAYGVRPLNSGSTSLIPDGNLLKGTLNRFLSYYSNLSYTLNDKYTLSGSARIDASNFFGIKANQRYVPLWSAGISWDIAKEEFFKSQLVSSLKLRATYGFNGNLDNSATALPIISYQANNPSWPYNNSQYASLLSPPNPGLTWEKIRMINIGIDFRIKDWFSTTIEYYEKRSQDLIGNITIEPTTGVSSYRANYAGMEGKGFDVLISKTINISSNLRLLSAFNFSYSVDKLTDYYYPNLGPTTYLNGGVVPIGKSLSSMYSYRWAGLDPMNGNPLGYLGGRIVGYAEILEQGSSSQLKFEDLKYIGSRTPRYFGSFLNNVVYKNLMVSFNLGYSLGYYFRRPSIDYNNLINNSNGHSDYSLRWQKPGDEMFTHVPSLTTELDNRYNFYSYSDVLIEKGDHIRLNDFRLSFDINKNIKRNLPLNKVALFIYANNLNLILWRANDNGIDPLSVNNIPTPKSIAFGLTLNY